MASIKLLLEKSRTLKNGTFSLVFQILHGRGKRLIYTPFKIEKNEFNESLQRIVHVDNSIRTRADVMKINKLIIKQSKSIQDNIDKLEAKCFSYDIDEVLLRYSIENDSFNLLNFIDMQIKLRKDIDKLGTAAAYKSTRASLAKFMSSDIIKISDVDAVFVQEYEHFLLISGVSQNTVCFYMRNLKSILNQAVVSGHHQPKNPVFKNLATKPQKTAKRALDRNNIRNLKAMNLKKNKTLELSRDIFMFSFYTRGMAFVDIAYLRKENIVGDTISYARHKTNQQLQLTVTPELAQIIRKYHSDSEFIMPILDDNKEEKLYFQYRNELNKINKSLKKIADKLKIDTPLTTYVARHSWATQAKECGAPTAIISEGLGHTSEKTTQIYLKQFDRTAIDVYNEKITRLIK